MSRPAHRPRLRAWLLTGVFAVAATTVSASLAAYVSSTDAGASFATTACYYRATVQTGTAVSAADGVTTVTIAPVDPARSFLMFSTRHSSNRPVASEIGGHLTSATTVEFYRDTNEATPVAMTIEWSVVTYPCGVNVQRGSILQTTATLDVPLVAVASTAQAFVLWSKNVHELDQTWDSNDAVIGDLTTTTNLEFRATALNVNHTIWWEVVEFTDPAMILVQRGSTSLTAGAVAVDVALPTAVVPQRSFVLVGAIQPNTLDVASVLVRGRLSAPSTVTVDRSAGTYDLAEIGWQAVELLDGSSVLAGFASFGSSANQLDATIPAVDPTRTNVFASTQTGGGQNGGRTEYAADDVVGAAAFALRLTSTTNVELTRDVALASGTSADVAYVVVSWGLP